MPNISVTALYRHPVKSFTPERRESLSLMPDGRVEGDRVLAFRFANAGPADDWTWQTKHNFAVLVNTPQLATVELHFDDAARRLRIDVDGLAIADGSIDAQEDREAITRAVTDFVLTCDDNPLTGHPERQPLVMVGDGRQGRFHDTAAGLVTLYSEESVRALGKVLGDPALDGRRFRANVVISGVQPFEEFSWAGVGPAGTPGTNRRIRIGLAEFKVLRPVTRCLTTHANPVTGHRDRPVMDALVQHFSPEKPQFAVMLEPLNAPCEVRAGAEVEVTE